MPFDSKYDSILEPFLITPNKNNSTPLKPFISSFTSSISESQTESMTFKDLIGLYVILPVLTCSVTSL